MPTCASCGAELAPDSRFCARCGAAAGASITQTTPRPAPTPTPPSWHGRFEPGTRLGTRYRVVGLLGRGGMGEVYRADDLELNQPVALKFLPGRIHAGGAELDRFRIAREISHPNVCRTYDISAVEGHVFLVMEYIDGEDLASVLRRLGRPSRDKAIEIARQLCLGLGAAHEGGILHRDLKPANVMIDGRGRVRITDFGLAGLDELFTGKRAHDARTPDEIRRLHSDSSVRTPSSLVQDVDPAVERVIMRCLETDPRRRPTSAYAVLGALPGGDPLAAAIAAGETPSPELVASAGIAGSLRPGIAVACLVFVLASFGWFAASDQSRYRGLTRSSSALALRAEEVVARAGIPEPPRYSYSGFTPNRVYLAQQNRVDSTVAARGGRALGAETRALYWRRWSPQPLTSANLHEPAPQLFDPPQGFPASTMALFDPQGRLVAFQAIPAVGAGADTSQPASVDWPLFVNAAGYDPTRMTRVPATRSPSVKTDSVTSWHVPGARAGSPPVTLLAGWLHGRIVHFSIDTEWGSSIEPFAFRPPTEAGDVEEWAFLVIWSILPLAAAVLFGIRNLRAGRGDRRGATALAMFVFVMYGIVHLAVLNASELGVRRSIWTMIQQAPVGHMLLHATGVWFMYIALEPYVRRLWPRVLVSWARLTSGRLRDPIIGRDILAGFVFAGTYALALIAARGLAERFGFHEARFPSWGVLSALGGTGFTLSNIAFVAAVTVLLGMAFFTLLLILRVLFRRNGPAIVGATILFGLAYYLFAATRLGPAGGALVSVVGAVGVAYLGIRFGLLAVFTGILVQQFLEAVPWTMDLSVWYSDRVLLVGAVLGALFAYGFWISLGGRSIFKDLMQEPAARAGFSS